MGEEAEADLRDLIDEAYSEDEQEDTEEETAAAPEESNEEGHDAEAGSAVGGDTGGGDQPGQPDASAEGGDKSPASAEDKGDGGGPKPPIDWDAGLREQWGSLPEPVRQKIADREQQMSQAMAGTSQARQAYQQLGQIQQQYGSIMAAEGVNDPIQAVQGLLQTATVLRVGSPQDKAAKIAELINHFGVDIPSLDSALAGAPPPQEQQQISQFQQMLDQRLQPVQEMMGQLTGMQQQQQRQVQESVRGELQEFQGKAEFLQDVRQDMSYLLNLATQRGEQMSLQQAYDKACSMNPQVQGVIDNRKQAAQLAGQSANQAAKAKAGVSLPSQGSSTSGKAAPPPDLHGALSAAWDDLAG